MILYHPLNLSPNGPASSFCSACLASSSAFTTPLAYGCPSYGLASTSTSWVHKSRSIPLAPNSFPPPTAPPPLVPFIHYQGPLNTGLQLYRSDTTGTTLDSRIIACHARQETANLPLPAIPHHFICTAEYILPSGNPPRRPTTQSAKKKENYTYDLARRRHWRDRRGGCHGAASTTHHLKRTLLPHRRTNPTPTNKVDHSPSHSRTGGGFMSIFMEYF